jgi:hypothetical protein
MSRNEILRGDGVRFEIDATNNGCTGVLPVYSTLERFALAGVATSPITILNVASRPVASSAPGIVPSPGHTT